jgi:hypothetical protein
MGSLTRLRKYDSDEMVSTHATRGRTTIESAVNEGQSWTQKESTSAPAFRSEAPVIQQGSSSHFSNP